MKDPVQVRISGSGGQGATAAPGLAVDASQAGILIDTLELAYGRMQIVRT